MATSIKRLIEIIISAAGAKRGAEEASAALNKVGGAAAQTGVKQKALSGLMGASGVAMRGVMSAAAPLGAALAGMFTAHAVLENWTDYREMLIDIKRLTGENTEGAKALEDALSAIAMSLPVANNELMGILGTTNALGIRGAQDVEAYTRAIAELGLVTDTRGKAVAETLGRLKQITGENVKDVRTLAAATFALQQGLGGSAATMTDTALVIAQYGAGMKISSQNSLALAAALQSVGAEGGTAAMAIGKLIRFMDASVRDGGEFAEQIARIAGVSKKEFAQTLNTDVSQALMLLIKGLNRVQNEGGDVMEVLAGLDLQDGRLQRGLLPLIKNYENLEKAMRVAGDAQSNLRKFDEQVLESSSELGAEWHKLTATLGEFIEKGEGVLNVITPAVKFVRQLTQELTGLIDKTDEYGDTVQAVASGLSMAFLHTPFPAGFWQRAINDAEKMKGAVGDVDAQISKYFTDTNEAAQATDEASEKMSEWAQTISDTSKALNVNGDQMKKAKQSLEDMGRSVNNELRQNELGIQSFETNVDVLKMMVLAELAYRDSAEESAKRIQDYTQKLNTLAESRKKFGTMQSANSFIDDSFMRQGALVLETFEGIDASIAPLIASFEMLWGRGSDEAEIYRESLIRVADTTKEIESVNMTVKDFGSAWGEAARDVGIAGESIEQTAENLFKRLQSIAFDFFITRQVTGFMTSAFGAGAGMFGFGGGARNGGMFDQGSVVPFGDGGITEGPELFPMSGRRVGLRGEAGREAVVPLPNGREIPVRMEGGRGGQITNVNMTVYAKDAKSFDETERQMISRSRRRWRF